METFGPIEHRLEPVGVVDGAEYFNDSKATNPDAVLKALTAFEDRPIIVLLGGRNKGNDFTVLAEAVSRRCRVAVLFGESLPELRAAFVAAGGDTVESSSMSDAVSAARELARPGDVVLLSPACASFDEFRSFEHRGDAFKQIAVRGVEAGDDEELAGRGNDAGAAG